MTVEVNHLTPIEKELRFRQWCRDEGVTRFLFDLDDTICPTREIFSKVMAQAYDFLASSAPFISRQEWKIEVEIINNRLFEALSVNAIRWNCVADELSSKYPLTEEINRKVKKIFQSIYSTPLVMMEGVTEGLGFMKKTEIPIGLVTHGSQEWTWKKYHWLDLDRFVDWDEIFIVDENKHKTAESWLQAMRYFKTNPQTCAVVGDSPRSDINPAWEIGVRQCFLVEDPGIWSVHNQPVNPAVKRIKNLAQIPEVVVAEVLRKLEQVNSS